MPLINEYFFDHPLIEVTRLKATGAFHSSRSAAPDQVKAPFGGIDPRCISYTELSAALPMLRVAHTGGRHNPRPNPYSAWWMTVAALDRIILFACSDVGYAGKSDRGPRAAVDVRTMFRKIQAVAEEFGRADYVFVAALEQGIACFTGKSRPIYRYKSSADVDKNDEGKPKPGAPRPLQGSYKTTTLSLPPILPDTIDKKGSYQEQVPGVEQIYVPGLSRDDYKQDGPHKSRDFYGAIFGNAVRGLPFDLYVKERIRILIP